MSHFFQCGPRPMQNKFHGLVNFMVILAQPGTSWYRDNNMALSTSPELQWTCMKMDSALCSLLFRPFPLAGAKAKHPPGLTSYILNSIPVYYPANSKCGITSNLDPLISLRSPQGGYRLVPSLPRLYPAPQCLGYT